MKVKRRVLEILSCPIMELLWEDRERRETQQHTDRGCWEEERLRREAEHEQHVGQMQLQLDMMKNLMERSQVREDEFARRARGGPDQLKLTKLTDTENIEAYLTTFERMIQVYEVEEALLHSSLERHHKHIQL